MSKKDECPPRVWIHRWRENKKMSWCFSTDGAPSDAYKMYISSEEVEAIKAELQKEINSWIEVAVVWEKAAKAWERDYDKMKEKYEPMVAVIND